MLLRQRWAWIGLFAALTSCVADPDPLPTQVLVAQANAQIERAELPPLYQMLYDYAFMPQVQYKEQRVRILIWLRQLELSEFQLKSLRVLHGRAETERRRIEEAERKVVQDYEPRLAPIYDELWDALRSGEPVDSAELEAAAGALLNEKLQHAREKELLELRAQGVQAVLRASWEWLSTLDPEQEALLTDATFFLRHRLDPYANPGDFRSLVGSVFVAGEYGMLARPKHSFDPDRDHLNLSNLWTHQTFDELQGPVFHDARRSIILYILLLEPALPEAIDAALGADGPPPPDGDPAGRPPAQQTVVPGGPRDQGGQPPPNNPPGQPPPNP